MRLNFICGRLIKTFHKGFIIFLLSIVAYNLQASRYIVDYPALGQDSRPGNIVLADKGLSAYRIVLPSFATIHEQNAAEVLQDYLLQISGAALPIITADRKGSSYEILLGQNDRLAGLNTGISLNELEADGFVIMTDSMRLIIAGGNEKGTLYGVYTFLEKYLGCRMYTPAVKIIPEKDSIVLGNIKDKQIPVYKFRDTHYRNME